MTGALKRLWTEESGQGMAEYGLILALVAVACIGAFFALGGNINEQIESVKEGLQNPEGGE
jgi:pilus assembly protein Flp/PilA